MTTHFVSRHPSAQEWVRAEGLPVDRVAEHLDLAEVQPGDRVLGSLPVNLAAIPCAWAAVDVRRPSVRPKSPCPRPISMPLPTLAGAAWS